MHKNRFGYIALIAVLIIATVSLSIGIALNILSIGETENGFLEQQSVLAFSTADSCLSEAYLRLERDSSYIGENLNVGSGSCSITVVQQGLEYLVSVESQVGRIKRRLQGSVSFQGAELRQNYWQELK